MEKSTLKAKRFVLFSIFFICCVAQINFFERNYSFFQNCVTPVINYFNIISGCASSISSVSLSNESGNNLSSSSSSNNSNSGSGTHHSKTVNLDITKIKTPKFVDEAYKNKDKIQITNQNKTKKINMVNAIIHSAKNLNSIY